MTSEDLPVSQPPSPLQKQTHALRQNLLPAILVLLGLSLGLNVWTLVLISQSRALAHEQVILLAEQVHQVQHETITADVYVNHTVPVQADIPIQHRMVIPIETSVHVEQTVEVAVANIVVPIPLVLDLPVTTDVPVTFSETVALSTTVPLDARLPIAVPVEETVLGDYLDSLHERLVELAQELDTSTIQP